MMKAVVRTEHQTLDISEEDGEVLLTLSGWVDGSGDGSRRWVILEVETGWTDNDSGLPIVQAIEFVGRNPLDIASQIMQWAAKVRLDDLAFEAVIEEGFANE